MSSAERELPTVLAAPAAGRAAGRLGIPEVYAALALLSFLVARFVPVLQVHFPCPFLVFTGHPCGTCGMTHAFVYLAHGHVLQAFHWSPLGALLAASAWTYALADLARVAAGRPFPALPQPLVRRWVLVGAAALLANWAYLLIHGLGE
jgi:hypothetical protein